MATDPPPVGSPKADGAGAVSPAPPRSENDAPLASVTRLAKLNPLSTFTVLPSSLYRAARASAVNGLSAPLPSSLMSPPCTKACVTSTALSLGFAGGSTFFLPRAFFLARLDSPPASPPFAFRFSPFSFAILAPFGCLCVSRVTGPWR